MGALEVSRGFRALVCAGSNMGFVGKSVQYSAVICLKLLGLHQLATASVTSMAFVN
jgi:hypothetical protein